MNAANLTKVTGVDHLHQSVRTILMTPKKTRVLRRDFGSDLHKYVDEPATPATAMTIRVETFYALIKWEPRITVDQVTVTFEGRAINIAIAATILAPQEVVNINDMRIAA